MQCAALGSEPQFDMVQTAEQVDMDVESADYDSLLHREHFGHGHEARVAAGKKVRPASRCGGHW
jgi:hypothetical protein